MKALAFAITCPTCGSDDIHIAAVDHHERPGRPTLTTGAAVECHHCGITTILTVTATTDQHRYPIGQLLELTELPSARECARIAGVTVRTWERWKSAGTIPLDAADRICVALGWHLEHVWPSVSRDLAGVG